MADPARPQDAEGKPNGISEPGIGTVEAYILKDLIICGLLLVCCTEMSKAVSVHVISPPQQRAEDVYSGLKRSPALYHLLHIILDFAIHVQYTG